MTSVNDSYKEAETSFNTWQDMEPLYYEEISVGQVWTSPRRTITETDVVGFAAMTGDYNPLHVDHEYAAKSHYRRPIAHGLLGLSWVAGLGSQSPNVQTLAFTAVRNWEFLRPIFFGDSVHVETECLEKSPSGRRTGKAVWLRKLINQNLEVVQQGVFETLVSIQYPNRIPLEKPISNGAASTDKSNDYRM